MGEGSASSQLSLNGEMRLTARDLSFKTLTASVVLGDEAGIKEMAFSSPNLQISSSDPKLNLTRALGAAGTPLNVSGDIASSTPLEPFGLFSAYKLMRSGKLDKDAKSSRTLPEHLIVTATLTAPSLTLNETKFEPIEAQNFVLKNRKLTVGNFTSTAMGGRFSINDANLDFSNAAFAMPAEKLTVRDVEFRAPLKWLEADMSLLPGVKSSKQAYALSGRMDAFGKLDGFNFTGTDRLRWDGAVKLKLALALQAPKSDGARPPAELVAPWSRAFTGMGAQMFIAFVRAAGDESSNIHQLSFDLPEPAAATLGSATGDTHKMFNGAMLALQAYLARTAGVDFERLEFEPVTPTIVIEKGFAKIETFKFASKGTHQGLEITVRNLKINLADEAFADEAQIYVSAIPKAARDRLALEKWPADVRDEFNHALEEGKLALRLSGRLNAPLFKFPWLALKSIGMRALFETEKINDLETLQKARESFTKNWGAEKLDVAAMLGDRFGVGLPMTVTSRIQGESIIDRIVGMPQSLQKLLTRTGPTITPRDALDQLINPEPDAAPVTPPPGTKPAPAPDAKPEPKN